MIFRSLFCLVGFKSVSALKSFHPTIKRTMSAFASVSETPVVCVNPLLQHFVENHGIPPFGDIKPEHYTHAFNTAFSEHLSELKSIVDNKEEPNFENTILTFDKAGSLLTKVGKVYDNLCSSMNPPELQAVQSDMASPLAMHESSTYMFPGLFEKINSVYESRLHSYTSFNSEQIRLIERFHLDFKRAGALFDGDAKEKYSQITARLAVLTTKFTQNIMKDESSYTIDLDKADLNGCPDFVLASARQAAVEHEKGEDVYVITLSRSLVVPFLTFAHDRDLREKAWRAWTSRGELDDSRDCKKIAIEILAERAEQAKMHGYNSYAAYATADTMAGSPAAVMDLLERVWAPAKLSADREREALEAYVRESGSKINVEPWDWRYYAEKVRKSKYDLDEAELKPYFPLDRMVEAVFDCANQLFGLKFVHKPEISSYHPDVQTYEVYEEINGNNKLVGIFLHDNFMRQYKASGAWMSDYRAQSRTGSNDKSSVVPIICNNNNFAKGAAGKATLLSYDDARTLFHEFGHGMHGMLSDVTYQRLSGTNVLSDFVELPSQLFEHWLSQPEVLKKHACHETTGEPIPDELLARLMAAKSFNQGFETIEYTASALVDQALHKLTAQEISTLDMTKFENEELARLGMPKGIVMRHRPAHFQHLFSGSSYASAYYVYLWAEVLDADGFDAFLETGNCFDPKTAALVRKYIYSSGNTMDPREAYRSFRGRDPKVEAMLRKKGLLVE
mmetsp:Transcript_16615/g.15969  ORF Transcript_16615/g.15969 Transcript_16615/m.15969 type:complete len:733 (-) Transcript_16615:185-2383(-)